MNRPRQLFAGVLLSQSQLGRQPAELNRPSLEFCRSLLEGGVASAESLLGLFASSDIGHERYGVSARGRGDVIQADFEGKRRAVFALPHQIQLGAYRTGPRCRKVRRTVCRMPIP